jgi:hypothetical protein
MMSVGNLDDNACLRQCVCGLCLAARVAICALATVVFHNGGRGCLDRFLGDFPLIKWPTSLL